MPEPDLLIGTLRITTDRVDELQDGRVILFITRRDIRSIHLRRGLLARHPVQQMIFGILLTIVCGFFVLGGINFALQGKILMAPMLAGCFFLLGLWTIYDAQKRGHYLEIWTGRGKSKFSLGSQINADDLQSLRKTLHIL